MVLRKPSNNNAPRSLHRQDDSRQSSRRNSQNNVNYGEVLTQIIVVILSFIYNIFTTLKKNPKFTRNIIVIILVIVMIFVVATHLPSFDEGESDTIQATTTLIGNNSIGAVYKEGPFGNNDSDVSIAYILGVHPRESGAHKLMEQALKEKADTLNHTYYLYKINVTSESTDYSQSRMNGQTLARDYAVPDMINNNFTFAIDAHYSNGYWGVSRFVFTPNQTNQLSYQLGNAIADNFDWMSYYVPPDPTSPEYVTGPLNDGGVSAIIYEAYTDDDNNVTLEHDLELVDFIDNWNFTSVNTEENHFIFF